MPAFTLCVPYYRQPQILARQVAEWERYGSDIEIVVVDDGSPEPARDVLTIASSTLRARLRLYRIRIDVAWNREGARNLAASVAASKWLCMVDIDHVLPAEDAARLVNHQPNSERWYRFRRFRNGKADETRMKDDLPREAEFGEVKPHIDSYLVTREAYWHVQGYDESFVGCLGGGTEFLGRLTRACGEAKLLPKDIALHVYTRDKFPDASVWSLSRDREEGKRRARAKAAGQAKPVAPLRFPWAEETLA